MTVTSQLCERITGTGYDNLGAPAIEAARRLVLDGIAIAIAGTEEEAIHILAAHHKEQGGTAQATAIGNGFRLNTVSAAVFNGAAMHVLDFEPMWSPANHALSTTLAGVLALAEARGATGREVLTALVKGPEHREKAHLHSPANSLPRSCGASNQSPRSSHIPRADSGPIVGTNRAVHPGSEPRRSRLCEPHPVPVPRVPCAQLPLRWQGHPAWRRAYEMASSGKHPAGI